MLIKQKIIAIQGPTASGKSTLGKALAELSNSLFIEEEWEGNPFLARFISKGEFAFETQKWFIKKDIERFEEAIKLKKMGYTVF